MTGAPPSPGIPPSAPLLPWQWARCNLFGSLGDGLLTIACLVGLVWAIAALWGWGTTQADWGVLQANLPKFFVGLYPVAQLWRIGLAMLVLALLGGLSWGAWGRLYRLPAVAIAAIVVLTAVALPVAIAAKGWLAGGGGAIFWGFAVGQRLKPYRLWLAVAWLLSYPLTLWLVAGGGGLAVVETAQWNGLLLTVLLAVTSILLCFPLGVLLALGRQSPFPILKLCSVLYIEVMRGLPLIGILFVAQVMFPLLLPPEVKVDRVVRAIVGFALFGAAYLAENVRGGLQAVPRGQVEAAKSLGLHPTLVLGLIVLPQALKVAIPSIVGQFIGLFKDTSLVAIVGLLDVMGMSRSILAQPDFLGRYAEIYLFVALLYWAVCYSMSQASQQLERALQTD